MDGIYMYRITKMLWITSILVQYQNFNVYICILFPATSSLSYSYFAQE